MSHFAALCNLLFFSDRCVVVVLVQFLSCSSICSSGDCDSPVARASRGKKKLVTVAEASPNHSPMRKKNVV